MPPRSRMITTHCACRSGFREAPVAAVLYQVRGLHIAAEVAAIDFRDLAFAANLAALQFVAIASRSLWRARRRSCRRPRSREMASAVLPFTSLQKIAMAAR